MKGFWENYEKEFWKIPNWLFILGLVWITWDATRSLEIEEMAFTEAIVGGFVFAALASLMMLVIIAFACLPVALYKTWKKNK